jgi:SAM-dependent methyltransferase
MTSPVWKIAKIVRDRGPRKAATFALYRLYDAALLRYLGLHSAMHDTAVNLSCERLGLDDPCFHHHNPTESYYVFRQLLKRYVNPGADDVFLDYGSGLGQALLMAATFPFRRIIGVEYSVELSAESSRIISRVRDRLACRDVTVVNRDAATYPVPDDVSVVYFFNPFHGPVLEAVVARIRDSLAESPRRLRIIFYGPGWFEGLVDGCDWLTKRCEVVFPAVSGLRFAIYESQGHPSPSSPGTPLAE